MKWVGEWWGIIITAEDKEDEEMLEQLKKKLPKQAEKTTIISWLVPSLLA